MEMGDLILRQSAEIIARFIILIIIIITFGISCTFKIEYVDY